MHGLDGHPDQVLVAVARKTDVGHGRLGGVVVGLVNDAAELVAQPLLGQHEQVLGRYTGRLFQVQLRGPEEVQDVVFAVDQDGGRGILVQQEVLGQLGEIGLGRQSRLGDEPDSRTRFRPRQDREIHLLRVHHADAPENPPFLRYRLEQVHLPADRLRSSQQQIAAVVESEVQQGNDFSLKFRLQVDEQIAATDQIELGKRSVADQVVDGEDHDIAELLVDLVGLLVVAAEKAGQPGRAEIPGDAVRVDPLAGHAQRLLIHVAGENLQAAILLTAAKFLKEQHGDGVGLLAGGATRHPDAQSLFRLLGLHQRGHHLRNQDLKGFAIAEKTGHADEQIPGQELDLLRMTAQIFQILRQLVDMVQAHAPRDAAHEHFLAVAVEIVPGAGAQQSQDAVHLVGDGRAIGLSSGVDKKVFHVLDQDGRHLFHRQDVVSQAAGHGALRHARVLRRARVLHHGHAPRRFHRLQAQRPVRSGPGHYNANGHFLLVLGQRTQEKINGGL